MQPTINANKPFSSKEHGPRKNISKMSNSYENSPGKLMNNFKSECKLPDLLDHDHSRFRSDFSMTKTLDFSDKSDPTDYCEKCK